MLTKSDLAAITEHGISVEDVTRQLAAYARPPAHARLVRPCTPGDGIVIVELSDLDRLLAVFEETSRRLRVLKFVPASGAASRMFRSPLAVLGAQVGTGAQLADAASSGDEDARAVVELAQSLSRFAFTPELAAELGQDPATLLAGDGVARVLDVLLNEGGLGLASLPKGLIKFHRYADGVRTPLEEQLVEAADHARDGDGRCRVHFTVSPEHLAPFEELAREASVRYGELYGVRYEIGFSLQKGSTDAVAVTPDSELFREPDGRLLFRPAGHGALIENLADLDADIVFIKNIDNVVPDHLKEPTYLWKRALGGLLAELRERAFAHVRALDDAAAGVEPVDVAIAFITDELSIASPDGIDMADIETRREYARAVLDRPMRVCGMVRNEGEPGGGPFWVDSDGVSSRQIVESSQVDPADEAQQACFAAGTHFNPVDLVCSLRDGDGKPYDLSRFIDHDTAFIADKSRDGRPLRSFERPGLWNGAMSAWNTIFVEVPPETFNPVKTVNDLLRPSHQPLGG